MAKKGIETGLIKVYPDSILRVRSTEVEKIGHLEKVLFRQMLEIMKAFKGVGIAAPQIGISRRLIVVDTGEGPVFMANPRIINGSGLEVMEEGCLSVPGALVDVSRKSNVTVTGINEKGKFKEIKAEGFFARALQHEIDHLEGKLIIDYMPFDDKIKFGM
ncbi:MAG: peptide deformylase [Candidatus Goldbacteria bacterium]|nr:peptide deformylase [Candidatus Goldiibacteriota bacterium]